ncbi:hypothetical protein LL394_004801 [Serratia marcescens]|uniref:Phage protein n=1 Tax=Serratia marcescens TaxID=615 RepID=A0AA46K5G6_SERMA|nr:MULTISPECIES: hypothetical protein [Yersiniaceae]MBL0871870.1 hypothetical protein [Serratia nevei]MBN5200700.1 hypothetical protein [Serratia marcescens]MBN5203536.1 hypothetical protein [Serratia marcescens]MDW7733797.1 hypothetical protein [Serratia marcescens]RLM12536.1 hypothetical protein BIY27_11270 [Gibbsiella quercinecans]
MAINYTRMRATATRLLTENGQKRVLTRGGKVTRVNGKEVRLPDEKADVIGVVTEYKPGEIDGTLIQNGDVLLVATYQTEIRIDDRIEIDGKKYRVVHPHPVKPAAVLICYRAQLRA